MSRLKSLFVLVCLAGLIACSGQQNQPAAPAAGDAAKPGAAKTIDPAKIEIAVIPKGTTNPFWKTVHAGAVKAEKELGIKTIWTGAENEDDRNQQIQIVQNFISRGVTAIVLAPLDDTALVRPVEEAVSRGIPVIIIDSGLKSEKYNSFVATDNAQGGRLGAEQLGKVMNGKGKALMLRYAEGSDSTNKREEGFLEVMKAKFPGIQLVSTDQYAGVTKESAMQASQNLLNKFADIEGIFCPNESSAFGMMRALENSGKAGKIKFVGFDASEGLLEGLKKGEIQGLVAQDPFDMGYQGVKTAFAAIQGKPVNKRVPTRLMMVTPENMNNPEVKEVTSPDIDKWLK